MDLNSFPSDIRRYLSEVKTAAVNSLEEMPSYLIKFEEHEVLITWNSIKIGSSRDCDIIVPDVDPLQAEIKCVEGRTLLINHNENNFSVYRKVGEGENFTLEPGYSFRIGTLEFEACRFNVGRAAEKGVRPKMEDTDIAIQNLFIYPEIPISFFAIFDGHGGDECSVFLRENFHKILTDKWRKD